MEHNKLKIKEAVIVEGKYDKNTLSQVIDAVIIACSGFQVFKNQETREYILRTAIETGIIVLTDADASGFMIRSEIHSFVPSDLILDAYVPALSGKEKRKDRPGKEGLLGVEGMRPEILLDALKDAGAIFLTTDDPDPSNPNTTDNPYSSDPNAVNTISFVSNSDPGYRPVSVPDLVSLGLNGCPGSTVKKQKLLKALSLPSHLNTKELLAVINRRMNLQELERLCQEL